ncbi:MAG: hypothetical protein R2797_00125 [Gelidibacter sp.]
MSEKDSLQTWLGLNKTKLNQSIFKTKCAKWKKWQEESSLHIFPCACPVRNPECIFIETYYKLENALEIMRNEAVYTEALNSYQRIRDNADAVIEWARAYESLGLGILHFEPNILITVQAEPYLYISTELPTNDISQLLKFKEIFTECYYSEQYENY